MQGQERLIKALEKIWQKPIVTGYKWLDDILKKCKNESPENAIKIVKRLDPTFDVENFLTEFCEKYKPKTHRRKEFFDNILDKVSTPLSDKTLDNVVKLAHASLKLLCVECGLAPDTISEKEVADRLKDTSARASKPVWQPWQCVVVCELEVMNENSICSKLQSLIDEKIKAALLERQKNSQKALKAQEKRLVAAHLKRAKMAAMLVAINQSGEKMSENSRRKRASKKPRQERAENVEVEPKFFGFSGVFDALFKDILKDKK